MFEGFTDEVVDLGEAQLRVRSGGKGPPLLLIHGHPRTSARMTLRGVPSWCATKKSPGR